MFEINKMIMKSQHYVILRGKKIFSKRGKLDLSNKNIHRLSEIKGLERLRVESLDLSKNFLHEVVFPRSLFVKVLLLGENKIRSISGLENLSSPEMIDLSQNPIDRVDGFQNMENLYTLYLEDTEISQETLEELGGVNKDGMAREPERFVTYCKERYGSENSDFVGFL